MRKCTRRLMVLSCFATVATSILGASADGTIASEVSVSQLGMAMVKARVQSKTCNSGFEHLQARVVSPLTRKQSCALAAPVAVPVGFDALNAQAIAWNAGLMAGRQLYVSTAGSDTNPGTARFPL